MKKDELYKFFTCSKEDDYIDDESFEEKSLVISGNGQLGLIKFYDFE